MSKIITHLGICIGLLFAEDLVFRSHAKLTPWYANSTKFGFAAPKLYGATIFINVVVSAFVLMMLGGKVGSARKRFAEEAKKDGDKDAELMFALPKMQAEGYSERAKLFNCVQRGHQQALESYPMFLALSMLGGIQYPAACAIAGIIFCYSRLKWAEGYATGNPGSRYDHWASFGIWGSLLTVLFATGATAVKMLLE